MGLVYFLLKMEVLLRGVFNSEYIFGVFAQKKVADLSTTFFQFFQYFYIICYLRLELPEPLELLPELLVEEPLERVLLPDEGRLALELLLLEEEGLLTLEDELLLLEEEGLLVLEDEDERSRLTL
jgi:hypothetical protein